MPVRDSNGVLRLRDRLRPVVPLRMTVPMAVSRHAFGHGPMPFAINAADQLVRFVVTSDLLGLRIEMEHPANPGRDIPEMTERRGEMADLDIRVRPLAAFQA